MSLPVKKKLITNLDKNDIIYTVTDEKGKVHKYRLVPARKLIEFRLPNGKRYVGLLLEEVET